MLSEMPTCLHVEMNFWGKVLLNSSGFFVSFLYYMTSKILALDGSNTRKGGDKVTRAASALLLPCLNSCVLAHIIDSCNLKVVALGHEKQKKKCEQSDDF